MNKSQNILRAIKLSQYLCECKKYVLSKQALCSGTTVSAFVPEVEFGQSKANFISKLSISLKEANETLSWLSLLNDSKHIKEKDIYRYETRQ